MSTINKPQARFQCGEQWRDKEDWEEWEWEGKERERGVDVAKQEEEQQDEDKEVNLEEEKEEEKQQETVWQGQGQGGKVRERGRGGEEEEEGGRVRRNRITDVIRATMVDHVINHGIPWGKLVNKFNLTWATTHCSKHHKDISKWESFSSYFTLSFVAVPYSNENHNNTVKTEIVTLQNF